MRILSLIMILLFSLSMAGCTKGNKVNARSMKTANKSVSYIKERLPADQRIEFEVSFWTLRDEITDNEQFLDTIDGKTPEELIELGKASFQKRKDAGFKDYQQYANWEQMIAQFSQQRLDQNRKEKQDNRDKKYQGSVIYKL